jgi:hypoxanthine phosphoribosyltransferase
MRNDYNYTLKYLSWDTIKKITENIINIIKKSDCRPDVIIPILRGGMPLALILSQSLDIRNFETLQILKSENNQTNATFGKAKIVNHTDMRSIHNKNVLIAEDVIDTLDTLNTALHFIKKYKPKKIIISTIIDFTNNKDYNIISGKNYQKKYWIVFPWE